MKCLKCGSENRPGAHFCRQCGEPMTSAPGMAPTEPTLPASVHITGGVSGQVAIGTNILQIGDVNGGVVNVMMPGQKVLPRPRPTPVDLRPRPFLDLLDREVEIDNATTALQSAKPIEFHGRAGLGKTTLLRYLAHHPAASALPDGVIYLSVRRQPVQDLLQSLYDAFYEGDIPFKPTEAQLKHDLQNKRALVLLDDVELAREDVQVMLDTTPICVFLLGSPEQRLWGEGQSVALRGLPPEDALALIERELGRPLTPEEQPSARSLCDDLEGHPLRLIQVAAKAREENRPLTEVVTREEIVSPLQALDTLPPSARQLIAALAAMGGAPLHVDHLAAMTGLPDAAPALQTLSSLNLAQAHSPRYTLTGDLAQMAQQAWDLTPWMERALTHFAAWAGDQQSLDRLLEDADAILRVLEWAVDAGRWADVLRLGRAIEGALALNKRWAAWSQVLGWIHQAGQALGDQAAEGWALHQLGTRALCLGDAPTARTSLTQALRLREALGDRTGAVVTQHNLSLLPAAPPPPPKGHPPFPRWLLPVAGLIVGGGILAAIIGAAIIIPQIIATPTPQKPTPRPTQMVTEQPTLPPPESPWIVIELDDGCDREYHYGDESRLLVQTDVGGPVKIWLDGDSPIGGVELAPEEIWDRDWVFENLMPGEHAFSAQLMTPEGNIAARAQCAFTLAMPCADFENLPTDRTYIDGESFASAGVTVRVIDGGITVGSGGHVGDSKEILLQVEAVEFTFDTPPSGLTLRYSHEPVSTPYLRLEINNEVEGATSMEGFDGLTIGGVQVTAQDGVLRFDGSIEHLVVGALDLYIDDVCPQ
jgi:hypothetical protein